MEISFCTDNAKAYNNNVLPVMIPFICKSILGMEPSVYVHPDACCGKSCVDAHLAVSFRHLKRYILETRHDVLTPEDIVDALTYDRGVKNTLVDFIKTDRGHETILRYDAANEAKLIAKLRKPCEVRYETHGDGSYTLTTYIYSKCCFRKLEANGNECFRVKKYAYEDEADEETL